MRLNPAEARRRFAGSPVLRLATAGADGRPHLVPCTFALDAAGRVVIGIDDVKPKSTADLRRLRNIAENPRVSLLADRYSDDWRQLWWARADGVATIERSGPERAGPEQAGPEQAGPEQAGPEQAGTAQAGAAQAEHWRLLRAKYPQYEGQTLAGPVIVVQVESWTGWAYA